MIDAGVIACEIALILLLLDLIDDKLTFAQVPWANVIVCRLIYAKL